ncbi:hypothetical protein HG536_0E03090 [Torulaspora globosa]|uniref:Vacuolar ATPase assembly protein VMA22 n=1 Tax=Torulaspora globosa TaxID=48254 RepID=A0A7G3ZIR2_9SACH|nr:uncharacterized protein HG536_0E03090 [Torulaspora globosa]QLL33398.1 hypothetical protein HG536_0E03090 [Torulaspora globosa]
MDEDADYLELLRLLSRYDLLLEQLQKTMGEGFQNLGRANYHNKNALRGRYGSDYWDECYEGQIAVERQNDGSVSIVKLALADESEEMPDEDEKVDEKLHEEALLRRRNQAKQRKLQKTRHREPLTMFGGIFSVPTSLRQCQTSFKGAIPLVEELINCKLATKRLLDNLEERNGVGDISRH